MSQLLINNVQQKIQSQKSYQKISKHGRIILSKKGWFIRFVILSLAVLAIIINIQIALELEEPLLLYVNLLPIQAMMYLLIGWLLYKNPATGEAGNDLVSIIIPVYNQESMIELVIEAIYQSTYKNFEVLTVNDGSKDKTGKILDALVKKYPNFKVIHKKNDGKRKAVATAFFESKGKYIILIDSDSIIDKHAITEIMKTFNADPKIGAV